MHPFIERETNVVCTSPSKRGVTKWPATQATFGHALLAGKTAEGKDGPPRLNQGSSTIIHRLDMVKDPIYTFKRNIHTVYTMSSVYRLG